MENHTAAFLFTIQNNGFLFCKIKIFITKQHAYNIPML